MSRGRGPEAAVLGGQGLGRISKEVGPQVLEGQLLGMQQILRGGDRRRVREEGRRERGRSGIGGEAEGGQEPGSGGGPRIQGRRRGVPEAGIPRALQSPGGAKAEGVGVGGVQNGEQRGWSVGRGWRGGYHRGPGRRAEAGGRPGACLRGRRAPRAGPRHGAAGPAGRWGAAPSPPPPAPPLFAGSGRRGPPPPPGPRSGAAPGLAAGAHELAHSPSGAPSARPRPPGARLCRRRPRRHVLLLLVLEAAPAAAAVGGRADPPSRTPSSASSTSRSSRRAAARSLGAGGAGRGGGGAGTRGRADRPRSLLPSLPPSQWRRRRRRHLFPAAAAPSLSRARAPPLATARARRRDRCRITAPGSAPRGLSRRGAG